MGKQNEQNGPKVSSLGENIMASIDDAGILTIRVDTNKRLRQSASGKATLIATAGSSKTVHLPDGETCKFSMNLYVPIQAANEVTL